MKVRVLVLHHPPTNLGSLGLSKMDKERYHATQYQEDAHQIIEDFRKNHYDDTEDKGDDSSNESHITM
jgi:hypothetical protein